jgi:hypothetical protein
MFDQNNVNLAPDAIGTQPRSSTTIPIAPLLAKSLASTGDARAEIILRSMITGYRARSGHWQPQPKQPSAPLKPASNLCKDRPFFPPGLPRARTLNSHWKATLNEFCPAHQAASRLSKPCQASPSHFEKKMIYLCRLRLRTFNQQPATFNLQRSTISVPRWQKSGQFNPKIRVHSRPFASKSSLQPN